jgi:hypothetical protein
MILGMTPLTFAHVAISLVGIASGFVVAWGLLTARRLDGWTVLFLTTTVATSVTGFIFFPFEHLLPSHVLGIISLVVLAIAIVARYRFHLSGVWRVVYVASAVIAFYFNFFVLIVQSFQKIPALQALAPTQSEPPFVIAQLVALGLFIAFGVAAVIKFRVEPASVA